MRKISDDGEKMLLECSTCGLGMALRSPKKGNEGKADPAPMLAGMS